MIRRYIIWRNNHAYDERLRRDNRKRSPSGVALYGFVITVTLNETACYLTNASALGTNVHRVS
jgi:hypothetical protein